MHNSYFNKNRCCHSQQVGDLANRLRFNWLAPDCLSAEPGLLGKRGWGAGGSLGVCTCVRPLERGVVQTWKAMRPVLPLPPGSPDSPPLLCLQLGTAPPRRQAPRPQNALSFRMLSRFVLDTPATARAPWRHSRWPGCRFTLESRVSLGTHEAPPGAVPRQVWRVQLRDDRRLPQVTTCASVGPRNQGQAPSRVPVTVPDTEAPCALGRGCSEPQKQASCTRGTSDVCRNLVKKTVWGLPSSSGL